MKKIKFETLLLPGICFLIAFLLLSVCSRSSFLYPCNDWNDANSYFTMGKALMNGQIIYRDLYDQKGPVLYLIYGIAYLFSHDSFKGVFVLEIIAVGLFLLSMFKILNLYCKKPVAYILLPVLGMAALSSKSFYWGGAAEEFCLPFLGFGLYFSIKYFKEQCPESMPVKTVFLNGIFAGIILLVKYTMLGFYIAFMGMILLVYLVNRKWTDIVKACLVFLCGMLIMLLPWLIFFGVNGALDDWYQCYVYNNLFIYSNLNEESIGIGTRIYTLAKLLYWLILDNFRYFIFIIIGVAASLLSFKNRWYEKLNVVALCGLTFLGIYAGGSNLPYYSIPLICFAVLGFCVIGSFADRLCGKLLSKQWAASAALLLVTAACVGGAYKYSMNTYFMQQDKDTYFLYQFKRIVEQEEHPTLLNMTCLDAGLYTVADIMPVCRFFQTNGIGFEEMFREQDRYIEEGLTQFVLTRDTYPEAIWRNYELVSQAPYEWNGTEFTYYLFKRRTG